MSLSQYFKCAIVLLVTAVIIGVPCMIANASGYELEMRSFAVDSSNRLYIQYDNDKYHIHVFEGGELLYTINLKQSLANVSHSIAWRGERFTIQCDNIVLVSSTYVYTLDLQGKLLEYVKDTENTLSKLSTGRKEFLSDNGERYQLKSPMGRTKIIKNDTVMVYQMSVLSAIVKWAAGIAIIAFVLGILAMMKYIREEQC